MALDAYSQLATLVSLDSETFRLTHWEIEFVDSVEKSTRAGRMLTSKQAAVIERLWDDVFIHGKRTRHD